MLRLSGLGVLGLGLGAHSLLAADSPGFRFVVISDIHCRDERCHVWFHKVVTSMRQHQPVFCLINGDLSESALPGQLAAVRDIFGSLGVPLYATIGNHDYSGDTDRSTFEKTFPGSINYHFEHAGWQFIGLDSTQGHRVYFTSIQPPTLAWLDATLPTLDPAKPTVVCTHFPLGTFVLCRPFNADDLLARFQNFNLCATFSGHWHGYAERHFDHATVTNSRCGSWWRRNLDNSPEKGYFLSETAPGGAITHKFIVVS